MPSKVPMPIEDAPHHIYGQQTRRQLSTQLVMLSGISLVGLLILCISHGHHLTYAYAAFGGVETAGGHKEKPWAMYSPYTPVAPYKPPPKSCQITQVNILQRHGARYPTDGSSKRIVAALAKLQAVTDYSDPSLSFLNEYKYTLGQEDLVPLGAQESSDAGETAYARYKHLVQKDNIPFVRVSDSPRVIDSATNWTAGFSTASQQVYTPPIAVVFSEEEGTNSTLDHLLCPKAGKSDPETDEWTKIFAPLIRTRLSSSTLLSPAQVSAIESLADSDVYALLTLCPFESVAYGKSPFCKLFASGSKYADYWGDIDKYYYTGYGQPLGRVQGVGYVNELIARLTSSPVQDQTQTNRTLDSNPLTFPLNRNIYADFSHDNQLIAIYSALGLFNIVKPLDTTKIDHESKWKVRRMVPFAARMVVEKMDCQGEEKVRILVNDAVMPLEACGGVHGICSLGAFVKSQAYSRHNGEGDFAKCFE